MRKQRLASLLVLAASLQACVTVPNTRAVSVLDRMANGAAWSDTVMPSRSGDVSLTELIDFLEPQPDRTCVPVPGFPVCADDQSHGTRERLPARAGAIIQSAEEWRLRDTALKQACRELGSHCKYEAATLPEPLPVPSPSVIP